MTRDFVGRVIIITGAWRGIGRAAAERFLERGASVAVNVRDRQRADSLATSIGERALAVPGDVAAAGVAEEIVRCTLERFGRVDVVVNNAAFARSTRFPDLTAEEWREALEVNITAPFLLTKAVLPAMKLQRYGRIINISSSAGRTVSTLGGAHYTASKAGLLGFTRAAAKELGKFGITATAICPGLIDTELTRQNASAEMLERLVASYPVPRLGTTLEVADLICFAASEAAGYITGALFVGWFYSVPLHLGGLATIAFAAVFLSFAVPGIPRGAFIMLTPLFLTLGLPAEGIGILIAVDAIPDLFATVLNSTGDLAAAALVARDKIVGDDEEILDSEPE